MNRNAVVAVAALCCTLGAAMAQPSFRDPLVVPAAMSRLAAASPLMAVAHAGTRLVAVGERGHVMTSDDAGRTWNQSKVPVSSDLVGVYFATARKGWAVGHDGVVLHTNDGGASWTLQLDGARAAGIALAYYEKQAQGDNPQAAKSLEEARRLVKEGADKPFLDVYFQNDQTGYIVGAFNLIFKTEDGGKTWAPWIDRTENEEGLHLRAIRGYGDEVFIAGERGLLLKLDAKAQRFVAFGDKPYNGSYFGLLATPRTLIVAGLRGNAFRSMDAGVTWHKIETGLVSSITGVIELAPDRMVLVSQGGHVLLSQDAGATFTPVGIGVPTPFYAAARAGSDRVALVGARGARVEQLRAD